MMATRASVCVCLASKLDCLCLKVHQLARASLALMRAQTPPSPLAPLPKQSVRARPHNFHSSIQKPLSVNTVQLIKVRKAPPCGWQGVRSSRAHERRRRGRHVKRRRRKRRRRCRRWLRRSRGQHPHRIRQQHPRLPQDSGRPVASVSRGASSSSTCICIYIYPKHAAACFATQANHSDGPFWMI